MNAAEGRAHSGALLDESDAAIEIAAAEKNVVEQSGHVLCCPRDGGRDDGACGDRKEGSARNGLHMQLSPRTADYTFERGLWRAPALGLQAHYLGVSLRARM